MNVPRQRPSCRIRPPSSPFLVGSRRPHPPFAIADPQYRCRRPVQDRAQPPRLFRIDAALTGTLAFVHGREGTPTPMVARLHRLV